MKVFNKMDVARKVWLAVMRKYGKKLRRKMVEIDIEAYWNGRESGYTVRAYLKHDVTGGSRAVQFATTRGSDQIVVYPGLAVGDRVPERSADAVYARRGFAPEGDFDGAAKLVAKALGVDR